MVRLADFALGVTLIAFAAAGNFAGADAEVDPTKGATAAARKALKAREELLTVGKRAAPGARKLRQTNDQLLLVDAIVAGDRKVFSKVVKKVDLNDPIQGEGISFTPLELAVVFSREKFIPALIRAGADPNLVSPEGVAPIALAISASDVPVVKALIRAGADPNLVLPEGVAPISLAIIEADVPVVKALINNGVDPSSKIPGTSLTPIFFASFLGNSDVVDVLLDSGVDPSATIDGFTYLDVQCLCLVPPISPGCNC